MRMSEVQKLLNENGIEYSLSAELDRASFYRGKGFRPTEASSTFRMLTIPNHNHAKDIEIIFTDASNDPGFFDMEFGGYWYELFGCLEEELPQMLLEEIQYIIDGRSHVIFATDAKTGRWIYDSLFCDTPEEEWNDMDTFRKAVQKIKSPRRFWRKLIGRTVSYEIYNWENYEKVVK